MINPNQQAEHEDFGCEPEWCSRLDADQRAAAKYKESHSLIVAGPGAGKTLAIQAKVYYLVQLHKEDPKEILAVAFTRVAARQLRTALDDALRGITPYRPDVATIHSFALRQLMLNRSALIDVSLPLFVADDFFEREIILDDLRVMLNERKSDVQKEINKLASGWDNGTADPEADGDANAPFIGAWKRHRRVYGYTLRAELVYQLQKQLSLNPSFKLKGPYRQIIVDEYQDLNACELSVVKHLGDMATVTAAGDDDQSIYGFRNATPVGIRRFVDIFSAQKFELTVCYRCGEEILDAARFVIDQTADPDRLTKHLTAHCRGARIEYYPCSDDQNSEAKKVAEVVGEHFINGECAETILILLRSDHQKRYSAPILNQLAAKGYVTTAEAPDPRLMQRVRTAAAVFRAFLEICEDRANSCAWRVVVQFWHGSRVGKEVAKTIFHAADSRCTYVEAIDDISDGVTPHQNAERIGRARDKITEACDQIGKQTGALELVETLSEIVAKDSVVKDALRKQIMETVEDLEALDADQFRERFAQRAVEAEAMDIGPGVHILTMHKAKGVTADTVIIPVAEKHVLPGQITSLDDLEEARRLFYVALTRAKSRLVLTTARYRTARQGQGQNISCALTPFISDYPKLESSI